VGDEDEGDATVRGHGVENFLKASSPPAEATNPATGSSGRPTCPAEASSSAGGGNSSPDSETSIGRSGCGGGTAFSEAVAGFFLRLFAAIADPLSSLGPSGLSL